jgi:gluconokinase
MTEPPRILIVMGVSGAGKSTFGAALAAELGRPFLDADDLHPAENKAKMAAGIPLTDGDRAPWLDIVATAAQHAAPVVVACSALRRRYRDQLRAGAASLAFVELVVPRDELVERLSLRSHEFMPSTLLDSQLDTLEPLEADEPGIRLPYGQAVAPGAGARAAVELLTDLPVRRSR